MKQAVILCGGKGSRLGSDFSHLPKALVPVDGIPLLDHILGHVARVGISEVILAAGHLGEQIYQRYQAHNPWGLKIHTHIENEPLGTAGCLHEFSDLLLDDFLLLYSDVFLDFNLSELMAGHARSHPIATILVRQSDHPRDSDLVSLQADSERVLEFLPKATRDPDGIYHNWGNAAVYACSKELLNFIPQNISTDLATDIFPKVLAAGKIIQGHFLEDTGYVKDMGTPTRLIEVERYWQRKKLALHALDNPRRIRAVILDRDGVILYDQGPATDPGTIAFLPLALEGLAALRDRGFTCLVATNQPWIARGLLTTEQMDAVHQTMIETIFQAGGKIAGIAHSPYHPETHHAEGIPDLRRASECRKPSPGMLFDLLDRHGLSPAEVVMAGDSRADVIAAKNAGMRSVLIGQDPAGLAAKPNGAVNNLLELAKLLDLWNTKTLL
jgi:histidinol-phosphate phosphatase family protein